MGEGEGEVSRQHAPPAREGGRTNSASRGRALKICFFGTPDFATPPLRSLLGEGFDVVGVVTQPDKPRGRSRSTLVPSPVKEIALAESIPVLQPEKPRGAEFLAQLRALAPDLNVVVAYGHLLPNDVIDLPPMGTINIHASLLPALRGAAPIQAAIRNGLRETGVTIMRMVQALDAGPIILQLTTPVADDETYGELQLRLSELGAQALIEALAMIGSGTATETPQDDGAATYAAKVDRATARVDWSRSAEDVARVIRAYDPKPGAWTTLRGADLKLFGARAVGGSGREPGAVIEPLDDAMIVSCGSDAVRIAQVQPAGRARMGAAEWMRGRGAAVGDVLGR